MVRNYYESISGQLVLCWQLTFSLNNIYQAFDQGCYETTKQACAHLGKSASQKNLENYFL